MDAGAAMLAAENLEELERLRNRLDHVRNCAYLNPHQAKHILEACERNHLAVVPEYWQRRRAFEAEGEQEAST
jgi:hypothetical protein